MSDATDLARTILGYINDPYKPPEGVIQLIRESCDFSLRARPQEPGDLISREAAIEALEAEVADSDKQWERLVDGRFGGSEREAGRGGGLRRAVDVIWSLSAPQEPETKMDGCVFCELIARGDHTPNDWSEAGPGWRAFTPLNPVTKGHLLVVPTTHVSDALERPDVTANVMGAAATIAKGDCNLITSVGEAATQSVRHLHIHIVPRRENDGLQLPWSAPSGPLSDPLQKLVDEQAEDEGLWCQAANIVEAYLQQELRRLHSAIESRGPLSDEPREKENHDGAAPVLGGDE
jgi:histidine triad (HIT) family protein